MKNLARLIKKAFRFSIYVVGILFSGWLFMVLFSLLVLIITGA